MPLSRKPKTIDAQTWWYDERGSISIIHQELDEHGNLSRTVEFRIKRSALLAYIKRSERQAELKRLRAGKGTGC